MSDKDCSLETNRDLLDVAQLKSLSESVGSKPRLIEKWIRALSFSPSIAFVLDDESTLIGFGRIETDGTVYTIYDMCVRPDMQGRGIGSEILRSLPNQAKTAGVESIGLSTWTPLAEKFYIKHGFRHSDTKLDLENYMMINLGGQTA